MCKNKYKTISNANINKWCYMVRLLLKQKPQPKVYGKYGFRSVKILGDNYIIDEISNKLYEKNKKIINKMTITDIDLIKYIKLTKNKKLIKACEKIIKLKPTILLKDFLDNFISDFNNNCLDFGQFYEQLFYKITS